MVDRPLKNLLRSVLATDAEAPNDEHARVVLSNRR